MTDLVITRNGITAPVLKAVHSPHKKNSAYCYVYCPHCKSDHQHGAFENWLNPEPEHRVAHCKDGPLKATGYFIHPDPRKLPEYGSK